MGVSVAPMLACRAAVIFVLTHLTMLVGGCARYEYDIVEPRELARHIGSQADVVLKLDPLTYRLRSYENYLVIRAFNSTEDSIRLRGDESYIVDSQGQSHPLRTQAIAPHSYVKFILPPLPPEVVPTGPMVGIGIGPGSELAPTFGEVIYQPVGMRYANDGVFWEWNGEGEVQMSLTYQRDAQPPFTHKFLFRRRKM